MTKAATAKPKKEKVVWQYLHDGVPLSLWQNKISSIAWWYTYGIKSHPAADAQDALTAAELRDLLAELGVKDPKSKFKVTLPNGVVIESRVAIAGDPALGGATPRAKATTTTRKAAPRATKRLTKSERAELAEKGKKENERLKRWRDKGSVGNRPATPALDVLKANPNPRTQKREAATSQALKRGAATTKKTPAKRTTTASARKNVRPRAAATRTRGAA